MLVSPMTDARELLKTRRSISAQFLAEPAPNETELAEILTVASRVPDHGKLTPWRLVVFKGDARTRAGEKIAELAVKRNPALDEAGIDMEKKRFLPAPVTIGIISSPKPSETIPEWEQFLSAGNVAFNLEHAAFAMGFAATWTSRWYAMEPEPAKMLGAREGEKIIGFIHIGTPMAAPEDRPRPPLADVVTYWGQ